MNLYRTPIFAACLLLFGGIFPVAAQDAQAVPEPVKELLESILPPEEEPVEATEPETTVVAPDGAPQRSADHFPLLDIEGKAKVFVVPIEGPISNPQLFILRRAIREALDQQVDVLLLQMDTPGGDLKTTLEMMEALDQFEGTTVTYVNTEAISAGSYIAVATDHIFFAPKSIIGAAEVITGTGEDVPGAMKRKIDAYMKAKVRTLSDDHRYRAAVQRAMMDPDYLLEIEGTVLKEEGELLALTATEAVTLYGEPPVPLLGEAIAEDKESLLAMLVGEDNFTIQRFEVTWSERFALWFKNIAPLLMGLGMVLLFIEFKTPNFGILGGLGVLVMVLVFMSNFYAGLAGYEPLLVFLLGVILIAVELFLFPGTLVFAGAGLAAIFGSLLWAMAGIWPDDPIDVKMDALLIPMRDLGIAVVIAVLGIRLVWKYLPNTWLWRRMVLSSAAGDMPASESADGTGTARKPRSSRPPRPAVGTRGRTVSALFPSGTVEVDGVYLDAVADSTMLEAGTDVEIVGYRDFGVVVREYDGANGGRA